MATFFIKETAKFFIEEASASRKRQRCAFQEDAPRAYPNVLQALWQLTDNQPSLNFWKSFFLSLNELVRYLSLTTWLSASSSGVP